MRSVSWSSSVLATLASAALLHGSQADDSLWRQVEHLNRDDSYTFASKDGSCQYGIISKFSSDHLQITKRPTPGSTVTIPATLAKNEVVYIGQFRASGPVDPRELVFSARSSWRDLGALMIYRHSREHVRVVLKSGKTLSGIPQSWSETQVSLGSSQSLRGISKEQVAKAYYVRIKPIPGGTQYLSEETPYLLPFDPEVWPYLLNMGVHMDVLLYDALKPDEESPFTCKAAH